MATLAANGLVPVALPLMAFGPPTAANQLAAARMEVTRCDAVMFVSPQAVQAFLTQDVVSELTQSLDGIDISAKDNESCCCRTRCWVPGPGSAKALLSTGVHPGRIDQPLPDAEQFDSEALWAVVAPQVHPDFRLLVVRGEAEAPWQTSTGGQGTGREWLADRCRDAGATVQMCAAYRRQLPAWSDDMLAAARIAADNGAVWLLSSSEGVSNLAALLPDQCWGSAFALATHSRIAQAASRLGFGDVRVCRPAVSDVLQTLKSWQVTCTEAAAGAVQPPKISRSV